MERLSKYKPKKYKGKMIISHIPHPLSATHRMVVIGSGRTSASFKGKTGVVADTANCLHSLRVATTGWNNSTVIMGIPVSVGCGVMGKIARLKSLGPYSPSACDTHKHHIQLARIALSAPEEEYKTLTQCVYTDMCLCATTQKCDPPLLAWCIWTYWCGFNTSPFNTTIECPARHVLDTSQTPSLPWPLDVMQRKGLNEGKYMVPPPLQLWRRTDGVTHLTFPRTHVEAMELYAWYMNTKVSGSLQQLRGKDKDHSQDESGDESGDVQE